MNLSPANILQIKEDIFKAVPRNLIAEIIVKNYPEARITDKLIDSYIDLALSKEFTLDEAINKIRKLNSFDSQYEGKTSFVLDDKSEVLISEDTFNRIKESINNNEIVQFMRKNKENFIGVVDIIKEDK